MVPIYRTKHIFGSTQFGNHTVGIGEEGKLITNDELRIEGMVDNSGVLA